MKNLTIRPTKNKEELKKVFEIRETVFIRGQKVSRQRERDDKKYKNLKYIIVLYKNKAIGCARIRFIKNKAKLERIALLKKYRKKGFGKKIMEYLIKYCKKNKAKEIIIHSQYYIRNFYKKQGFKQRGKIFMDAGIKHVEMYI